MKSKHKIFLIKIESLRSIQKPDIQTPKKLKFQKMKCKKWYETNSK